MEQIDGLHAVVLAGGQGTRLHPYTTDLPKALVPVGDKSILEHFLRRLKVGGVIKVTLALNHMGERIREVIGDGESLGLTINYATEPEPLSTVGPLALVENLPENFIVANADILTDLNVRDLFACHLRQQSMVTVAVTNRQERVDYGVMRLNDQDLLTGFEEKPLHSYDVSMGVYVFSKSVLEYIPDGKRYGFDDLMLDLLAAKERVSAFRYGGYWRDIGRPDDYEQALQDMKEHPERFF